MNPAVLAGRWFLALCIALVCWAVASLGVAALFRMALHIQSQSYSGFSVGLCIGTMVGVWVGAAILPASQRKSFSILLCVIMGASVVFLVLRDIAQGTAQRTEWLPIFGSVLGISRVVRKFWPKWAVEAASSVSDTPKPSKPSKPQLEIPAPVAPVMAAPAMRTARPAAKPAGPPVFGRRR